MTVNEVLYNHVKRHSTMVSEYNGVYYILNNNKVKQPYAGMFLIDDTKDVDSICVLDQGQARFQCDTFTSSYTKGINKREKYQNVVKELEATKTGDIHIWKIEITNVNDRHNNVNALYQFTFEAIIHWERTS